MGKGGKAGRNPLALLRGGRNVDELFAELDADGSGSIERSELRILLQQLGRPAAAEDLDRIMKVIDEDESGEVELNEFKTWWATETGQTEDVVWTSDPVTGEEGFFDGNGVWVTHGWTDEGGFSIEPAGQFNGHGKWCANGLFDAFAADGAYVESGSYDEEGCWVVVEGHYQDGKWVVALLPGGLPGEIPGAPKRERKQPEPMFTSLDDAFRQIEGKDSVQVGPQLPGYCSPPRTGCLGRRQFASAQAREMGTVFAYC